MDGILLMIVSGLEELLVFMVFILMMFYFMCIILFVLKFFCRVFVWCLVCFCVDLVV